ncbi:MAG: carboxypeptidase-like regulatory domain-containing protein [bacterium]
MKCLTRYAVPLVLMVSSFVFCAVAPTQTKPNKKTSGGQVSGSVTIRGKPAAGVVVRARANDSGSWSESMLKATTNEDGKYHIRGISPGTYVVKPIAWGFVPSENSEGWNGKSVVIAEDESIENLDFTLIRGGVITGKVTDANGRPLIEETVNLMWADQRRPYSFSTHTFRTDDRGIYRIFGIPAGRFKVSVGQGAGDLNVSDRGRTPYQKTFFLDTPDPAKANVVEVAEGTEATNIDITVGQTVHVFSANGRVVDGETGGTLTNVTIHLTRKVVIDASSASFAGWGAGHSDREGEFKLENLVPGHYLVSIYASEGSDMRADPVEFDVVDQDVTGLLIKTSAGASLEGKIVLAGPQDSSVAAKLTQLYLSANVLNEGTHSSSVQSSRITTDGRFRIGGLQSGIANFSLGGGKELKGFTIVRIERDGAVQPDGIQLQTGEHLTGVKVVVACGSATIHGVVVLENGTLPVGGSLSIHLTKPADTSFSVSAEVDSRGHFAFEGLVAGSYELTVYVFGPVSPQRARWFRQFVNVAAGVVTEVTVPIDLNQNAAPTPARP